VPGACSTTSGDAVWNLERRGVSRSRYEDHRHKTESVPRYAIVSDADLHRPRKLAGTIPGTVQTVGYNWRRLSVLPDVSC
jgi:hypothetical protein